MHGRWRGGAAVGIALMLSLITGWVLREESFSASLRARYLSLRLLPPEEWGFRSNAHGPVPIPLPPDVRRSPITPSPSGRHRQFRVTISGSDTVSDSAAWRRDVPVYVRLGTPPPGLSPAGQQTVAALNHQFLQYQVQRQTERLQMFQSRLEELRSRIRHASASLRPPQKRVMEMEVTMLQAQTAQLQYGQMMTLQALTHAAPGTSYLRMTLAPRLIVSEPFLQRMATEGETVRLGAVEFARARRVKIEAID